MNKLFISQNRGGGVDPIITFTFGGNSYYSEGESKLVYYDYNNNEHVLKTWNKASIIDFTVNIPKNIITSIWCLQWQLNNAKLFARDIATLNDTTVYSVGATSIATKKFTWQDVDM